MLLPPKNTLSSSSIGFIDSFLAYTQSALTILYMAATYALIINKQNVNSNATLLTEALASIVNIMFSCATGRNLSTWKAIGDRNNQLAGNNKEIDYCATYAQYLFTFSKYCALTWCSISAIYIAESTNKEKPLPIINLLLSAIAVFASYLKVNITNADGNEIHHQDQHQACKV